MCTIDKDFKNWTRDWLKYCVKIWTIKTFNRLILSVEWLVRSYIMWKILSYIYAGACAEGLQGQEILSYIHQFPTSVLQPQPTWSVSRSHLKVNVNCFLPIMEIEVHTFCDCYWAQIMSRICLVRNVLSLYIKMCFNKSWKISVFLLNVIGPVGQQPCYARPN